MHALGKTKTVESTRVVVKMSRKRRDGATPDDAMAEHGEVADIERENGEEIEEDNDDNDLMTRNGEDGGNEDSEDKKKGLKRKRNGGGDIGSRRWGMPLLGDAEMRANFLDMQVSDSFYAILGKPSRTRTSRVHGKAAIFRRSKLFEEGEREREGGREGSTEEVQAGKVARRGGTRHVTLNACTKCCSRAVQ